MESKYTVEVNTNYRVVVQVVAEDEHEAADMACEQVNNMITNLEKHISNDETIITEEYCWYNQEIGWVYKEGDDDTNLWENN